MTATMALMAPTPLSALDRHARHLSCPLATVEQRSPPAGDSMATGNYSQRRSKGLHRRCRALMSRMALFLAFPNVLTPRTPN